MLGFDPPLNDFPPPKEGEPPLHRAARVGDVAAIRRLVAAGEPLDATFNTELDPGAYAREATPLMVAAGSSDGANVQTLAVLLELGADPALVIDDRSAVTFACEGLSCWYKPGGDAARLRYLLEHGGKLPADPQRVNDLLCCVARAGDAARVAVLLDAGANARGYFDRDRAREEQRETDERMNRQFPQEPPSWLEGDAQALADYAAEEAKEAAQRFERQTSAPAWLHIPLFRAAESGSAACVTALLAARADAKARDNSGRTAVHYAASAEVLSVLTRAGLSLSDTDDSGWSALETAMMDGEAALPRIKALIAAGADVNATHDHGYTVFMSAVGSNRYPALLRTLVAAGANPHAVSEYGYNAFHAAIDVNFEANAQESVRDTLGYLKELGVNIEHRNQSGLTPLARAIESGTPTDVAVLCELGADVNAVCTLCIPSRIESLSREEPVLFHALVGMGTCKDEKTLALLRAGANPLVKDAEGQTPLSHAVADLCREAPDDAAAWSAFYAGLQNVFSTLGKVPCEREAFVAAVAPPIGAYVTTFAASIPLDTSSEYAQQWRDESIAMITALAAYTAHAHTTSPGNATGPANEAAPDA